jgi:hypothetical protein
MGDYIPIERKNYTFYKWIHTTYELDDFIYVGNTSNFTNRKARHKSCCNNPNDKNHNLALYKKMREYGYENFKMVILGTAENITKREAEAIEEEYRIAEKANLNGRRCYTTDEQKKQAEKQAHKIYYEEHKEQLKQYREEHKEEAKAYREEHKQVLAEKRKQVYQDNKTELIEKAKKYYQDNKAERLEKAKAYNEANKEEKAEQRKLYIANNKEKVAEQRKKTYETHKEKITEYNKAYREAHKETYKLLDDEHLRTF